MKKKWSITKNLYNAIISHRYPVSLIHFVTERCNARCPHCFVDLKKQNNELTLSSIEKIASTSGSCLRNVALTGGEPFLREDLQEIADIWYSNSTAQSISLTTNGSLPDRIEKFSNYIAPKNIPVAFFFSYDFIGEQHSEYRKLKDLHLKVLESYKIVQKYSPLFSATFQITINPQNYKQLPQIYDYILKELNIKNINCTMIRGDNADKIKGQTRLDLAQMYKKIHMRIDKDLDNGFLEGYPDFSLTNRLLNAKNRIIWKEVYKTFIEKKFIIPCRAGSLLGIIYSNGDVAPCELLNIKAGNLSDYDYDFLDCWLSENAQLIKKNITDKKCFCTFECAWLPNILSCPKYYYKLITNIIKSIF